MNIPTQARSVFRLLSTKGPLSAKQIGVELAIWPNTVYRSASILRSYGFIKVLSGYPIRYQALPLDYGVEKYLQSVKETFASMSSVKDGVDDDFGITFIHNRSELLDMSNVDIGNTLREACFIVSGLEVPAETMLAYKKAIERGVRIRIVIQNKNEADIDMLNIWKKAGIKIRYYPLLEARIVIFDSKVTYLTSYNPHEQEEGSGVRFSYRPISVVMQQMFEERWKNAKEIP